MRIEASPSTPSSIAEHLDDFLHQSTPELRSLWAKSGDEEGWLNLPQHLADAACVAERLWNEWAAHSLKQSLHAKVGMPAADVRVIVSFIAGVHDVAKATRKFSCQIEYTDRGDELLGHIRDSGLSLDMPAAEKNSKHFHHGLVGEVLLTEWLVKRGCRKMVAAALGSIVGAHHGVASSADDRKEARVILSKYPAEWRAIHEEIFNGMAQATGFIKLIDQLPRKLNADVTHRVAGLVVMADWIASNSEAFPFNVQGLQAQRVERGMNSLELSRPWRAQMDEEDVNDIFRASFGWSESLAPRPVQSAAYFAATDVRGPCLLVIEAPTGEGKTEAALAAAHRLAGENGAQGLLVAAPTMGTANGLFQRVLGWTERVTPQHDVTSMNLVHSRSALSREFSRLRFRGVGEDDSGEHGSVVANQWMSGPKRALLSNFVVATVDQVLMLALQMRHSMLRHIGLSGKVIVIDECHAYDLYMTSYLKRALKWLARYDVSVVLLSATLPRATKAELIDAYASESAQLDSRELSVGYPLVTVVDGQGVREIDVPATPTEMEATIEVIDDSMQHLVAKIDALVSEGGCALIICNTIRRAQEAFEELSRRYPDDVELHHSAFVAFERAAKEDQLIRQLGAEAHRGQGRPFRNIICATQVAEQSLDIDADVLITDIAPMDLLIQRIGRIHRHQRPDGDRPENLQNPQVYIRGIEQTEPVPVFEGGAAAVYEPAVLLATMANLPSTFRRPDDIADLVQSTYSSQFCPPSAWKQAWQEAQTELNAHQSSAEHRARTFQIPEPKFAAKLSDLYERYFKPRGDVGSTGEEAGAAQVRDTDPTIEVIPVYATEYGYTPLPAAGDKDSVLELFDDTEPDWKTAFHLASSVIRLPASLTRNSEDFENVIDQLEKATPIGWSKQYLLKGQVALKLNQEGEIELNGRNLRYSPTMGLKLEPNAGYGL